MNKKYNPDEEKKALKKRVKSAKGKHHSSHNHAKKDGNDDDDDDDIDTSNRKTIKRSKSDAINDKKDNYAKDAGSKVLRTSNGYMKKH